MLHLLFLLSIFLCTPDSTLFAQTQVQKELEIEDLRNQVIELQKQIDEKILLLRNQAHKIEKQKEDSYLLLEKVEKQHYSFSEKHNLKKCDLDKLREQSMEHIIKIMKEFPKNKLYPGVDETISFLLKKENTHGLKFDLTRIFVENFIMCIEINKWEKNICDLSLLVENLEVVEDKLKSLISAQ